METLQPILQGVWRNRFWITCGLIAVISAGTWYLASTSLDAARDKNAQSLETKNSAINRVRKTGADLGEDNIAVTVHPNTHTQKGMQEQIALGAEEATEAWRIRTSQLDLQPAPELPKQVRDAMAVYDPPEGLAMDQKEPIAHGIRQTFMSYIPKRIPELVKIVGTSWKHDEDAEGEDGDAATGGRGGRGKSAQVIADPASQVVVWDEDNQDLWHAKCHYFNGHNGNERDEPTTAQMLALQQDLWILEGVFEIIKDVNGDASANDLASIKEIDHVLIGADALKAVGQLSAVTLKPDTPAAKAAAATGTGLASRRTRYNSAAAKSLAVGGSVKAFDENESESPFHGRYVDRDYNRISATELHQVLNAEGLSDKSYLAVAKRVPVRVAVRMDERKIGDFLAAAANSPFNFEVRQVRINKHTPGEGAEAPTKTGGGSGGTGGFAQQGGGLGRGGDGAGMADAGGSTGGGSGSGGDDGGLGEIGRPEQRTHFDVKIEFNGIIKLYNPVNASLFGAGDDPADPVSPTAGQ